MLAIFGSRDQLISPASHTAYSGLPNVHVNLIDGAGHSPNWEQPARTADLIDAFALPARQSHRAHEAPARPGRPGACRASATRTLSAALDTR
jgi:hypothetical protein